MQKGGGNSNNVHIQRIGRRVCSLSQVRILFPNFALNCSGRNDDVDNVNTVRGRVQIWNMVFCHVNCNGNVRSFLYLWKRVDTEEQW